MMPLCLAPGAAARGTCRLCPLGLSHDLQSRIPTVALRRDVDLIDLRAASTVVRMQVIVHGMALAVFDAHEQRLFETYTYSDYTRLNEERKGILDQVQRERTVYGR